MIGLYHHVSVLPLMSFVVVAVAMWLTVTDIKDRYYGFLLATFTTLIVCVEKFKGQMMQDVCRSLFQHFIQVRSCDEQVGRACDEQVGRSCDEQVGRSCDEQAG